ncbi:MAG: ABC transporter ATP-binding protein, partial [Clostridia bacterium]|nr:ABC transporter ATP-binding protein [Clostridia bacterium]
MEEPKYTGLNRFFQSDAIQAIMKHMTDGTLSEFIGDWKWIFSFTKKYRWIVVLYTVMGIVSSTMSLGSAYVGRILINIVVGQRREQLWVLICAMLGMTLFSLALSSVSSRIFTRISIYVNNDIQGEIFDRIMDARWAELSAYPSGDLLNRFNGDVGTIAANAINWIPNLIINIYTFAATFIILFRMDPAMAWIALLSAPFLLGMSRYIMRRMKQYRKRVLELNSQMMGFEVETFFNFDMIKSFGVFGYYSRKLRDWQKKFKEYNLDYNKFEIKSRIMLTLVSTAVSMAAFGYCLYRLWNGQILYGDMTFFLQQ